MDKSLLNLIGLEIEEETLDKLNEGQRTDLMLMQQLLQIKVVIRKLQGQSLSEEALADIDKIEQIADEMYRML